MIEGSYLELIPQLGMPKLKQETWIWTCPHCSVQIDTRFKEYWDHTHNCRRYCARLGPVKGKFKLRFAGSEREEALDGVNSPDEWDNEPGYNKLVRFLIRGCRTHRTASGEIWDSVRQRVVFRCGKNVRDAVREAVSEAKKEFEE